MRGRRLIECPPDLPYSKEEWASFSRSKRWSLRNPDRMKQASRSWIERNREYNSTRTRKYNLLRQYGITEKGYANLLEKQKGLCAICGTDKPTGKWKVFAVDHCHNTGMVRGLLCNECNRGIGLLRDNPEILRKAADYLDKNLCRESGTY